MRKQTQLETVGSGSEPPPNDDLISESEVLRRRPVLSKAQLVSARQRQLIRWTKGKRGSAWYRISDVDAYIKTHMEIQCHNPASTPSLSLVDSGSPRTILAAK